MIFLSRPIPIGVSFYLELAASQKSLQQVQQRLVSITLQSSSSAPAAEQSTPRYVEAFGEGLYLAARMPSQIFPHDTAPVPIKPNDLCYGWKVKTTQAAIASAVK